VIVHWVNRKIIYYNKLQMIVVFYRSSVLMLKRAMLFMSVNMT